MSDTQDMSAEARWRHLHDNGKNSPVDLSTNSLIDEKPAWLDELRWLRARQSILKFEIGVSFSSFTGLLLVLQLPEGLEPLLSTGNSKDIPSLFKRYLATVLHVRSWYDDDIFDSSTKGYKSIRQVRAMHKRVQSIMNERFKVTDMDGNHRYWYNQYDVAMTQFAFIGLALIYPEKTGLIAATHEELKDINYYWRVLGFMMGIEDEFNACQLDKYEDILEFYKLIFKHEYLEPFQALPCKMGLNMSRSICLALEHFVPLVTFNSIAHWFKDCFKFNGYEPQPMNLKEKILIAINRASFYHLMKHKGFLRVATKLHRKKFDQRLKSKDKIYELLKDKYKNCTEQTYYSERVDYFDRNKATNITDNSIVTDNETKLSNGGCPFGFEAVLPQLA